MTNDRDYLDITFNTIDEGITIYDANLCLLLWNDQYSRMSITPPEDLYRGASLLDTYTKMATRGLFGEGNPKELAQKHINSLKHGPLIESEFLTPTTNRTIRINRFRLKNGGVCATFRDVTEERQTELQLRQIAKLDALGKLTSGLTHDLNNILSVIIGNLELAQLSPAGSENFIKAAIEAADGGAHLIRGLLAFARKQPLDPVVTNVAEPLTSLQNMLPQLVGETIDLEVVIDAGLWLTEIDSNQFESSVLNLIVNAKDAMPGGGTLTIQAANARVDEDYARVAGIPAGQYVCVSVTDTGNGMSADVIEKAFDPFFTTKPTGAGTGLGLSMVHGFAKQSNGHINIYSEINEGTRIKLYLPRTFSPRSVPTPSASSTVNFSELRVLIVEDDDSLRSSIASQVRSLGCTVISASLGEEALKMASISTLDILLTDVVMPGLSGMALAEQILTQNPKTAVVYMSGYTENSIIHQGRMDPNAVLLQKPFRRADLLAAIETARRLIQ